MNKMESTKPKAWYFLAAMYVIMCVAMALIHFSLAVYFIGDIFLVGVGFTGVGVIYLRRACRVKKTFSKKPVMQKPF